MLYRRELDQQKNEDTYILKSKQNSSIERRKSVQMSPGTCNKEDYWTLLCLSHAQLDPQKIKDTYALKTRENTK